MLASCKSVNTDTTIDIAPKDSTKLSVHYQYSAGMLPENEIIYISNDTAYRTYRKDMEDEKTGWNPTMQELDDLYHVLLENNYWKITARSSSETVYDRGGVSLTIKVDGKETRIDNSGNSFLEEKWQENFAMIITAIKAAAARHE